MASYLGGRDHKVLWSLDFISFLIGASIPVLQLPWRHHLLESIKAYVKSINVAQHIGKKDKQLFILITCCGTRTGISVHVQVTA